MNRLPSHHMGQGNLGTYCDMNYHSNHNYAMDQQHLQPQPPPQHHQAQLRRNSNVIPQFVEQSYQVVGNNRQIYGHYTQQQHQQQQQQPQVSSSNQPMFVHSHLDDLSTSLYQVPGHSHENLPYGSQTSYCLNIQQMQHEPIQTASQLYTPMPSARHAPSIQQQHHHHHHLPQLRQQQQQHQQQQQQHQQFQYNSCIVMHPQQNVQLHHQEDYLLNQMHECVQVQALDGEDIVYENGQIIDQSQVYYQQEQMDLLPTIKQQQQQQQQLLLQQQQLHLGQQTDIEPGLCISPISMSSMSQTMHMTSHESQARVPPSPPPPMSLPQHDSGQRTELMAQAPQMSQLVLRSKSDLATSVSYGGSQFEPQKRMSANLNQRPASTSYLDGANDDEDDGGGGGQDDADQLDQQQQVAGPMMNDSGSILHAQVATRRHQDEFMDMRSSGTVSQDWLDTICPHLIEHMNRFGICVIDDFLGKTKGDLILKEVLELYNSGQYSRGRLVSNKLNSSSTRQENSLDNDEKGSASAAIRNDRVIWIDGYEDGCSEINNLIQTLCSVITNSSRLSLYSNNGLDKIVINKRTKAHVACYPGNGTRYIKHVDNPNNDGRVITSIYYLNKNWNTKRDGGLLRMFPVGMDEVANIEPLFDRVLFFWSDRRNPHEVLPAYRDRFAITVWYIGENRP